MKKNELINCLIENGYALIECDEFNQLAFWKQTNECRTMVYIYTTSDMTAYSIYRDIIDNNDKVKKNIATLYLDERFTDITGKALIDTGNYNSIVL